MFELILIGTFLIVFAFYMEHRSKKKNRSKKK